MFPRPMSRPDKMRRLRRAALTLPAVVAIALTGQAASAAAGAAPPASADAAAVPAADPAATATDRVIVQWADGSDHAERVEARAEAGVTYSAELGDPSFQLVEAEDGSAAAAAAALEEDPAVAVAEPDGYRTLDALPNDPLFAQQWGLSNSGQVVNGLPGKAGNDIDVLPAWERTVGSPNVVVADIDSGYRADSPDLGPVEWINPGEIAGNGIDDDHDGYVDDVHGWDFVGEDASAPSQDNDPTDSNVISGGHGVHTAGIIGAAGNNGVGITGVAQNVRIMPLRVCANEAEYEGEPVNEVRCPFSAIIAAINYAGRNGARVANLSLGGTVRSQLEINAYAANPGTLYVIAAGNDAANNDSGGSGLGGHHYPCDYRPAVESSPAVPGAIENTICVAALDPSEALASYSDYGAASVDLGAPGTAVISTFPASAKIFSDNFETNDFASKWTQFSTPGFGRAGVGDGPLTSFGITDAPGAAALASHVYGVKLTTPIAVPAGTGACRIEGKRYRKGGSAPYGYLIEGARSLSTEFAGGESGSFAMSTFRTIPITNLGGHSIQPFFEYRASASPASGDGLWLDEVALNCNAPLTTPPTYAYEDGTSMATPQVSGAAGLLFSLKPTATVTEVRQALLGSAKQTASLAGKTTTGGRLDVSAAMNALVPLPPTAVETPPAVVQPVAPETIAKAEEAVVAANPAAAPTPKTTAPPKPAPGCTVPKLAGKSLGAAKAALSAAKCKLGKVSSPKARRGSKPPALVVKSSTPAAGGHATAAVAIALGPKPKPHRH
jgi:subtilisin family serine protease